MKIRGILFDLDGTLTNPGLGITNSVMYSLKKYGIEGQPRESLYRFIGPPLHESYEKFYSFSREQAIQAVSYYREYYEEKGMFENEVYPGIKELLRVLTKQGILCLVATSKPEIYAKKIPKSVSPAPLKTAVSESAYRTQDVAL